MPVIRYNAQPISWTKLLKLTLKTVVNNSNAFGVSPVETNRKVAFVAGCGHSGTTLLAATLSKHPDVFTVGRESKIFVPSKGLYCSREIAQEWCYTAEQLGMSHIVEKTPKHVHTIERIHKLLPNARFVLMVRNPLDNCASLHKRFGNLKLAVDRWIMDNKAVRAAKSKYPSAVKVLSYEELTESPERSLHAVCSFLDLSWDPALLAEGDTVYDRNEQRRKNMAVRRDQVREKIKPNTGKWKEILTHDQAEYIRGRVYELADALGYNLFTIENDVNEK